MYYGERLNSISHLVGAVFALIAFGALLTAGIQTNDPMVIVGFTTFGLTMVLLYTMSTLYHSSRAPRLKNVFKLLDHISIYLLIAGSYTPFMLVSMYDSDGIKILTLVWTLAIIGISSEIFLSGRVVKVSQIIIYLGMGWACSLEFASLRSALPEAGFWWLVAGGIAYTTGVVFYVLDKANWLDHAHGIWHFFVLAGSLCHFVAVIGYVR
ncbi:hemolysin III family protein [Halieaceae bacterium IMCC14734]|uniref:Hemolysin III family protein n=1 Tax=Candidatus Litorirhabdus singularis TaxID=2518993 RepID=A0ABT3TE25_9GAMM|nr:hemolysin III family protein [Candidatus Litorirhabdus singularis]MCX2980557.1 hemolysin III family protein [Candidatus Litorirhabdus singularis]